MLWGPIDSLIILSYSPHASWFLLCLSEKGPVQMSYVNHHKRNMFLWKLCSANTWSQKVAYFGQKDFIPPSVVKCS